MRYAIGIDIGGTKVAMGVVAENGELLAYEIIPTNLDIAPEIMIEQMIQKIAEVMERSGIPNKQLLGIGIGAPGPLDSKKRMITCPPNLPNWVDVPIVTSIKENFSVPVVLENDANAATLAEKWIGAAKDNEIFVYITLSTGIGAGLYVNGKLVSGSHGNAGDVGHIVIDPSFGTCTCGQKGCFEWIASGTAIARQGSEIMGKPLSTKEVFDLYEQGHPRISQLIEEVFTVIGIGCVTLINLFGPEKIVIGGGVSQVGEPLFQAVRGYVSKFALSPSGRRTDIVPTALHQHVGIIGAAALILLSD